MAAVAGFAGLFKPQLTTVVIGCLVVSCLRGSMGEFIASALASVSASGVALIGLVVFPIGLAYANYAGGSSVPPKPCKGAGASLANSTQSQAAADSSSSSGQQLKLARPPFQADLSMMLQTSRSPGSSSSSSTSSSSGSSCRRRRRLPRMSVELTPLPRLSLDFSATKGSSGRFMRMAPHDAGALHGGSSSSRWAPAMPRISSTSDLEHAGSGGSSSEQQPLPTFAAGEATQSLGLSVLPGGLAALDEVISETHLLQVGAILGEASARGALAAAEAGGPVGHPSSFYGSPDSDEAMQPWELLVSEGSGRVLYWGWRRPMRRGLYMYMTRSVFLDATPAELRAFMMDDAYRVVWDNAVNVLRPLAVEDAGSARNSSSGGSSSSSSSNAAVEAMAAATAARISAAGDNSSSSTPSGDDSAAQQAAGTLPHELAFLQAMVHFPKPMASRSYVYARRVWPRPSDGGCYCLSRGCAPPPGAAPLPPLPGRAVAVEDYSSGCVIRAPTAALLPRGGCADVPARPAAEVFMVYFEDAHVRAGLANLGIKKGLWPMVQRTDKALRVYQVGAAANSHLQQAAASAAASSGDGDGSASVSSGDAAANVLPSQRLPAGPGVRRSVSLGGALLQQQQGAAALSRAASLQECSGAVAGRVPCFPLMTGSDWDDELAVEGPVTAAPAPCTATCAAAATNSSTIQAAIAAAGSPCKPPPQQPQQQSGRWSWLSAIGSSVASALTHSGQLLAAVSVSLWRSQGQVSLLLPRLEWRVLRWAYQRLAASSQLLLGPAGGLQPTLAAAAPGGSSSKLARVSSHPIADPGHAGFMMRQLASQVALCLPSHPLAPGQGLHAAAVAQHTQQQHPGSTPSSCCCDAGSEASLQVCPSGSCCSSSAGGSCSCCCCRGCDGSSCGGSVTSSHSARQGSRRSRSAGGSGSSMVHDGSGGRRHKRVVLGLVQTASMRIARKVLSALQQPHQQGPEAHLFDIDE